MKISDVHRPAPSICNFCHPNYLRDLTELTKHLFCSYGSVVSSEWIGGYSKEKADACEIIRTEFEKDKLVNTIVLDFDEGVYICKKHLIELAESL